VKSILITFADDVERDTFLMEAKEIDSEVISKALGTIKLDPPVKEDHERQCALFISGQKILEGNLSDLHVRFQQEIAVHSGSVVIKELRGGEWHEIRARRLQQQQ
jgi:hypothetical protein